MENETRTNSCYEDGIFISYAHVDNTRLVDGHKGWVDALHEILSDRLHQLLGEKPIIWRDPLLTRYEPFRETLVIRLREVAILVVILSPRYIKSKECMKELDQFCQRMNEADRSRTDTKVGIFKVIKTPIDDSEEPEELRELLGYKFYEIDAYTGRPREFSHVIGFDSFPKFFQSVYDLAWDIAKFIKLPKKTPSGRLIKPTGTTIYLAETESALDHDRNNIRRELESRGYNVLPNKDLPHDVTKLEQEVREDLNRSRLSLHLIGENYGLIPEKEVRSTVHLQYELAVERSADPKFSLWVWIPRELETQDDRQKEFIKSVRRDVSTSARTEVLQDNLEDLKSDLLDKLKVVERPETPVMPNQPAGASVSGYCWEPLRIYLICDRKDYTSTKQLKDFLYDEKFEVLSLAKDGNKLKVHNEHLSLCHVAMIFQGQASENWRLEKFNDLRKIAGNDPSRKLLAKAIYLANPMTEDKEDFKTREATVVKEHGDFPPKELIQFLEQVRNQASM